MNNNNKVKLLMASQVANRLTCSKRYVYKLIESERLRAVKIGIKKGYRISEDELERFIKENTK